MRASITLITRLMLLWKRFSPLERSILSSVRSVLPTSAQNIYDAQVQAVNRVQRISSSTEICFYRRKFGRVDWSGVPVFPRTDEFMLARVRFSVRGKRYTAKLYSVRGHIFDIVVTPNPMQVAFARWDISPIVQLIDNPMGQSAERPRVEKIAPAWREFLETHRAELSSTWSFYDENTAYRVGLNDGEYVVLAERSGDQFIIQNLDEDEEPRDLFYVASHEGLPEPIRGKLEDIIPPGEA